MQTESPSRIDALLESVATLLMAIATIATAWCAYQSTVFAGEDDAGMHEADVINRQINVLRTSAMQRSSVDVQLFTEWVDATITQDTALASFYRRRFPPQLKVAFEEWWATEPFTNPAAAPHPFRLASYVMAENVKADSLQTRYDTLVDQAGVLGDHSERYILLTVVFATVLFFGGISSNINTVTTKKVLVAGTTILLLIGLGWMLTFPMILR